MAAEGPPVGILRVLAGATGSTTQWTTNGLPTTATDHIGSDGGACTESTVAQSRRPSRGTNQRRGDLDRVKFEPLSVHDERRRRSTTAPRDTPLRSSQEGGGGPAKRCLPVHCPPPVHFVARVGRPPLHALDNLLTTNGLGFSKPRRPPSHLHTPLPAAPQPPLSSPTL